MKSCLPLLQPALPSPHPFWAKVVAIPSSHPPTLPYTEVGGLFHFACHLSLRALIKTFSECCRDSVCAEGEWGEMKGITGVFGGRMRNQPVIGLRNRKWLARGHPARHRRNGMLRGQKRSPSPGELTTPSGPHWTLCASHTELLCALDLHALCLLPSSLPPPPQLATCPSPAHMLPPPGSLPRMLVLTHLSHITQHSQTLVRIIPVHVPWEGQDSSYIPLCPQEHPVQCWACHTCLTGISGRNYPCIYCHCECLALTEPSLSQPLGTACKSEHLRPHSSHGD